jgi:CRISPR-associated endonuclease/helicase Cas3
VRAYFGELYWQKGPEALDAAMLDGALFPILLAIGERERSQAFPFESMARAFRVIDETMEPVVVPWRSGPDDKEAEACLERVAAMDRSLGADLRRLQRYTVSIPQKLRDEWFAAGVLRPLHPALGDALLRFKDLSHYDPETGVRIDEPVLRAAESNVM